MEPVVAHVLQQECNDPGPHTIPWQVYNAVLIEGKEFVKDHTAIKESKLKSNGESHGCKKKR